MVYFSSSAAYPTRFQYANSGILLEEPMIDLENTTQDIGFPDLSYGWAKLTGEYLAHLAHQSKKLNVVTYRPMSGYGEDQHDAYPFKAILARALNRENPMQIWSNATRDFMYIEDIVDCVLATMNDVADGTPINLGTGVATSFAKLAQIMANAVGYNATIQVMSGKPAGVAFRVGDPDEMMARGCKIHTPLEKGVQIALEYMRDGHIQSNNKPSQIIANSTKVKDDLYVPYSSFFCQGGSQTFDGWTLQHTAKTYPMANHVSSRVCMLSNVCWRTGEIDFFENPNASIPGRARLSSFKPGLVVPGYLSQPWLPAIIHTPRPTNAVFLTNATFFLSHHSFDDNFGHLLNDVVFPVITAAHVFNIPISDAQILNFGCSVLPQVWPDLWQNTTLNPLSGKRRIDDCMINYAQYVPLVLGSHAIHLDTEWINTTVCMKKVIVGHSKAYGLAAIDLQRAVTLRTAQELIAKHAGVSAREPITRQKIIVLTKRPAFSKPAWPSLCDDVRFAAASLDNNANITCLDPVEVPLIEQVRIAASATVFVAEHGTISYGALYAQHGACLLSIGSTREIKEPQVLLFASHIRTYYMTIEAKSELASYIRLCLMAAGARFDS